MTRTPAQRQPRLNDGFRAVMLALLSTTASSGLGISMAHAQAAPTSVPPADARPETPTATPDQATETSAEPTAPAAGPGEKDIIVTGSRIVRDGYQSPTPLSVIGTEQLAGNANTNLAAFVNTLPAFSGSASGRSSTTTGSNGTAGINTLNLRSLGPSRTLVLLDGHRVTPSTTLGWVDANQIPQVLVSRVDVVTGGASAAYGSDAVAGVVNFVLNRRLSGLTGELSTGVTNYGDNGSYKLSLAGGRSFADDRGHVLFAVEQAYEAGVDGGKRGWTYRGRQLLANPAYTATNGQPQRLVYDNIGYMTAAPGGVVSSGPLMGTGFGQGGQVYALNFGDIRADPFMRGGDWATNDLRPTNTIVPEEKRRTAFARANFEFAPAFNLYGQFSYIKSHTEADATTSYMIGNSGPLIRIDNAYLPQSVRDRMVAAGLTTIRVGTFNNDLGINRQYSDREALSYQLGADGKFDMLGSSWQWDAYGQYGYSNNDVTFPTNISRSRYTLATDAVRVTAANAGTSGLAIGSIACRSTLTAPTNGCSPYNALGVGVNDANQAGIAYIRSPSISKTKIEQTVVAASLTGSPFSTWAGPLSVALSAEYRKDKAFGTVDADSLIANHVYANYAPIDGSSNVKEAAFETVIPLAKDTSWASSLELNGAARYTSYSLAGDVVTWKVGGTYSPVASLTFRATRSRDIRAPNLQETFLPQVTARQSIFDPFTNTTPAFDQTTTGNRNLSPEKADTLGVGAVFQPSFVPGFSISADYWTINVKDAISIISSANTLLLCFDGRAPQLCSNITRAAPAAGQTVGVVTQVISQNINIASQKVRGIDVEASYRHDLDFIGLPGSLDLHANFTRYLENTSNNSISKPFNAVGENSGNAPQRWRTTATLGYRNEGFRGSLTARAFSSGVQFANYIQCTSACPTSTSDNPTINDNRLPGRLYLDLALSYDVPLGDARAVTTFFNVRNLTNKDPGLTVTGNAFGNGANAIVYDVDGIVFRTGIRFKL